MLLLFYDFQAHKDRLTEQLASHLNQPVRLGKVFLSLRHGPALSFSSLEIGSSDGEDFHLRADRLLLRMEWRSLWQGELRFTDVLLDSPELRLPTVAQRRQNFSTGLVQDFAQAVQVDSLTVRNGTLRLPGPDPTSSFQLRRLHASFQQVCSGTPMGFQFTGRLLQQGEAAAVQGHGELLAAAAGWQQSELHLELLVRQLQPANLLAHLAPHNALPKLTGSVDLQLSAHGSPTAGMQIDLVGNGGSLRTILANGRPLSLAKWHAEGRWRTTPTYEDIDELRLDFGGLAFKGALRIDKSGPEPRFTGSVASGPLPVPRLVSYWQPGKTEDPLRFLQTLHAGLLQFDARFTGDRNALFLSDVQLALRDGALLLPEGGSVEALSLRGTLTPDGTGRFKGEARIHDLPLAFKGEVIDWAKDFRRINAEAHGEWPAAQLLPYWPKGRLAEGLQASGPLPWRLFINGAEDDLQLELRADLLAATLHRADFGVKQPGEPGSLLIIGDISPQRLTLHHGELQLPLVTLQAHGHIERQAQEAFELTLKATVDDLRQLRPLQTLLDHFRLQGGMDLYYQLAGAAGEIRSRQGTLQLRQVGLHLGVIADLKDINGQLQLFDDRAESVGALRGRIGESPATATVRLHDFQQPVLVLQVATEAIRANELIFPSAQTMLRDVQGGLSISADGLDFQGIRVHLDGGTEAVVDGSLRNYAEPTLELQVIANYGNIDEIIALWQNPAEQHATVPPPTEQEAALPTDAPKPFHGSYRIQARVERGQLGNLRFEEARGEITLPGGDLLISPLTFHVGNGLCVGQVSLTNHQSVPELKISGTVENFDSAAIYNQLLKRQGVVSGTMRGNFHLQGAVGPNFLASSSGGGAFEVHHGVLRRFRFISKVFSILNVAQVLSFKLPDMAEKGMPFRRLRATFAIKEGVLSTDDLLIDSESMNLSLLGDVDLKQNRLDLLLGVKPLGTVDRILTRIPLAGWVLTGEGKALITAHFQIRGSSDDPEVTAIPISSLSETVIGIFSRVMGLPGKLIDDLGSLLEEERTDR